MKRILRIGRDVKAKRARIKDLQKLPFNELEMDVKLELIQELIPVGLIYVGEILREEVRALAGDRYKKNGIPGYVRWARQQGSIYLGDQKVPILYQRIRDRKENREIELRPYKGLQEPSSVDETLLKRVLLGLSCRRYQECCTAAIPEVFGLSPSTVSRRFIRASKRKLKELMERRLDNFDIVAIIIDGKTFKDDEMIIVLGITMEGRKAILGFIQDRGLKIEEGLLCILDGSKGIRKAVEEVFGRYALIQRCQWHKRENVVSYLPQGHQDRFREALQRAYESPSYKDAKESLAKVGRELKPINESAVKSLEEGLEETLTLHRLGLFEELGKSLKTTNCIESLMALIGQKTDKVDYWKNSNQKQRWLATALFGYRTQAEQDQGL